MELVLLIDFGSTYTKVAVVDLDRGKLVDWSQSISTVGNDIMIGLSQALSRLRLAGKPIDERDIKKKLACSSAAGGLRLVSIGLVPSLTAEAATRAALGAGAKVVGTYSYELTGRDIANMEQQPCDMILLAGGTDGGDKKTILHNAKMLANIKYKVPIVVAGNRVVSDDVAQIINMAGKEAIVTENVLPTLDRINVEPCRSAIREIFMRRIIHAKGIDKAKQYVSDIVMPTPMAVLKAAQLVAEGTKEECGLGELVVVDVGGATTDVCSVGAGSPSRADVMLKGLPEPYAKRTVEGDLGIRYNAKTILEITNRKTGLDKLPGSDVDLGELHLEKRIERLSHEIGFVPEGEEDFLIDATLAYNATELAVARHVGYISQVHTALGPMDCQYGKDLSEVETVIGVGGVFVHNPYAYAILEGTLFDRQKDPCLLKPTLPCWYIDKNYVFFGVGLLAEIAPTSALRIAKESLASSQVSVKTRKG